MKIGLLGCDDAPDRLRHIAGSYRDMFQKLLAPHVPNLELAWYELRGGEFPASVDACEGYICTGSRYSVYDDRDWIGKLRAFVRALHDTRKPFVGICFGHQMLAEALGGEVKPADYGWGVGIHQMHVVQPEAWMEPPKEEPKIQYMHSDQVRRLPADSTVLARAPHCEVAMFRVGDTMLGIEGHPEFPAAYVEALIRARRERIGDTRSEEALASLDTPADDAVVARWIANFLMMER